MHDPQRLVDVYNSSAATLNLVRAFTTGGYADLRQVHTWNTDFVRDSVVGQRYEAMANEIDRAMSFMEAIGADPDEFHRVDFHSSPRGAGARVRARDDPGRLAHRPALRRLGPLRLDRRAHPSARQRARRAAQPHPQPDRRQARPDARRPTTRSPSPRSSTRTTRPGRLTFITRFGAGKIRDGLPPLVEKVTAEGVQVAWVCDPMHGNTFEASSGYKTRRFDDVIEEVQGFFDVHHALGTWPGGVHVELTGDDVTECVGGGEELLEVDLGNRYESVCDPRLNRVQSLELAFLVAEMLRRA